MTVTAAEAPAESPPVNEVDALRSPKIKTGLAVAVIGRLIQIGSTFLLARIFIHRFGSDAWGLIGFVAALFELSTALDFSTAETTAYEASHATTLRGLHETLSRMWMLACTVAFVVGGVLLLLALVVPGVLPQRASLPPALQPMLVAAACAFVLQVLGNVYVGTLQGLGWVRETNLVLIITTVVDLLIVVAGIQLGLDLATIQWLRVARVVLRLLIGLGFLALHRLPIARPRRHEWSTLRGIGQYAGTYSVSKGLGLVIYRGTVSLAPAVVALSSVTGVVVADNLSSNLYRWSHIIFETLFPRLARRFHPTATAEELASGQRLYLAASLGISTVVVAAGAGLAVIGPWFIPLWLRTNPPGAAQLLPWVALAWAINSTGSPSTCLLLSTGDTRRSVVIHAIAVGVNLVALVAFGLTRGPIGLGWALALANAVLVLQLSFFACRRTGLRWSLWAIGHGSIYGGGLGAFLLGSFLPGPRLAAGIVAGVVALLLAAPALLLTRELRIYRELAWSWIARRAA